VGFASLTPGERSEPLCLKTIFLYFMKNY